MRNYLSKLAISLDLPEARVKTIVEKSALCMVLLFIPIGQFYSLFYALPLFILPPINSSSPFMGYTFAYFFPKSIFTVLLFGVYYFFLFYLIERHREKKQSQNDEVDNTVYCNTCNKDVNFKKKSRTTWVVMSLMLGFLIPHWKITIPLFFLLAITLAMIPKKKICAICKSSM